jgi:Uma2 family endonuclease
VAKATVERALEWLANIVTIGCQTQGLYADRLIRNLHVGRFAPKLEPMSRAYEEIVEGETLPRSAPGERHEKILDRLHRELAVSVNGLAATQLLPPRTKIQVSRLTMLCPDLSLVTSATGKLFLAVEVVSRDDHRADTVMKKEIYEQVRVPRLWMVDPRYDNVEVYHSFEFGLQLKSILAGKEILEEKLLPQFKMAIVDLFAA